MKRASRGQKKSKKKEPPHSEARGVFIIAASLFVFLCLLTFVDGRHDKNLLGLVGHVIAHALNYLFGLGSYIFVAYTTFFGWKFVKTRGTPPAPSKAVYLMLHVVSVCILLNLFAETKWLDFSPFYEKVYSETLVIKAAVPVKYIRYNLGGVPFYYLYKDISKVNLQHLLGDVGVFLTFFNLALIGFILLTDLSFLRLTRKVLGFFPLLSDSLVLLLRKLLLIMRKFSFLQVKNTRTGKKASFATSIIPPYTGFNEKKSKTRKKRKRESRKKTLT